MVTVCAAFDLLAAHAIAIAIAVCLVVRLRHVLEGLPLGVDAIRDVIYEHSVMEAGTIATAALKQLDYYARFPAMQLYAAAAALVCGTGAVEAHYIALGIGLSLGAASAAALAKRVGGGPAYLAALVYATLPTIALWNFWVIPMAFAIAISLCSLLAHAAFIEDGRATCAILAALLGLLTTVVHASVGILLLAYYAICVPLLKGRARRRAAIYASALLAVSAAYLAATGIYSRWIAQHVARAVAALASSLGSLLRGSICEAIRPSTRSMLLPWSGGVPPPSGPFPNSPPPHPGYYLAPRYTWAALFTLLPLAAVLPAPRRGLATAFALYGAALAVAVPAALLTGAMWKAERYLASPATVYIAISLCVAVESLRGRRRAVFAALLAVMCAASLLDPRLAYGLNPIEGDRISFRADEAAAARYLLANIRPESGRALAVYTDYNLMTSYLRYLSAVEGLWEGELRALPCSALARSGMRKPWLFLFRLYSVESYYIWSLNYWADPELPNKAVAAGNVVYSSGGAFVIMGHLAARHRD